MSFQALEIARSAMSASQAALSVASQNVANANTPGYVRQRVVLAPIGNPDPSGKTLVGGGVDVVTVMRLRDQCLEAQINHQQGSLGRETAQSASLTRIESAFPDLSDNGIASALGGFFDSLQRLQTTPGSTTARQEVISNAGAFCEQMHVAVGQLQEERSTIETDLKQQVVRANQLLHQVADLNAQVASLGDNSSGNDLKVTREEAIRELATICGASGLDQPHGTQDVLLGGVRLIQGSEVKELSLVQDPANPSQHIIAIGDIVDPPALAGTIAGDIAARDENLQGWADDLDELASTFADAFNAQHRSGVDLKNQAGVDFFTYTPGLAASSLDVNQAIQDDPSLLAAASDVGGPPGDGTNAADLNLLRNTKILSGGTETAEEYHGTLLHSIGLAARRATAAMDAREGLVGSLETQYANTSGVSLDEEAVDVMRCQQMYSAATKLVQVADSMVESLLQLL